ncbi:eukaryotic porin-domain-containing protein [Hysterangium stoloniferum]|nr:eukaryotic porin-domain-containing protein [Hysterangium stoloniferum]
MSKEELSAIPSSSTQSISSPSASSPFGRIYNNFYQWRCSLGLPNPGTVENLQREVKNTQLTNVFFDGARADLTKSFSPSSVFQVTHSLALGSQTIPASYNYQTIFVNSNIVMQGSIDNEGSLHGKFSRHWTPNNTTTILAQLSKREGHSMIQFEQDYQGLDYTAGVKAVYPGPTEFTGIYVGNYLQSVTKNLALGAEVIHQKPAPEMDHLSTSYLLKYSGTKRDWIATATIRPSGVHQLTYWQKISEKLDVAADLQAMVTPTRRDAIATIGAKYELRAANFRTQLDSSGKISAWLEQRLAPTFAFLVCGEIDHLKSTSKFGVGVVVEMPNFSMEDMEALGMPSQAMYPPQP